MKDTATPSVKNRELFPLRWRELGGQVLITDDAGRFCWLEKEEFLQALSRPESPQPAREKLSQAGLLRSAGAEAELEEKLRRRNAHLFSGPSLHIVILTLRCNQACIYCHASRKPRHQPGYDMNPDTARRVLEVIFQSPSEELTVEFQGGEPTLNFEVLKLFVEEGYARARSQGRRIYFSLVSNLAELTDEQLDFLVDHGVMVCTSIDGPATLHDWARKYPGDSSYRAVLQQIERFRRAYEKRGLDTSLAYVNALVTVSRRALQQPRQIIDEYVRLGQKVVHLRPLNPFGMGQRIWRRQGYRADEFLRFYRQALQYILELNRRGVEMMEKLASLFLIRILTDRHHNYMDLRSPCGAALGQLAYNYDGRVYSCDEGRMVGAMGDDIFCLGDVRRDSYREIISHPCVRSLSLTSCLECLPGCSDCAYLPYCGVCPVYNYVTEGDLVARAPQNERCLIQKGILDELFLLLRDDENRQLLSRWTEERDRSPVYRPLV